MKTSYREPAWLAEYIDKWITIKFKEKKKKLPRSAFYTEATLLHQKYAHIEDTNKVFADEFARLHQIIKDKEETISELRFRLENGDTNL